MRWTSQHLKAIFNAGCFLWISCGSIILFLPRSMNYYMYILSILIGMANALMMVCTQEECLFDVFSCFIRYTINCIAWQIGFIYTMALFGSQSFEKSQRIGPNQRFDQMYHLILVFGSQRIKITVCTQSANFVKATWRSFFYQRIVMCLVKMQYS